MTKERVLSGSESASRVQGFLVGADGLRSRVGVLVLAGSSGPTAGSDQEKPTVFSALVAVDFKSPKIFTFPPEVASVTVKVPE